MAEAGGSPAASTVADRLMVALRASDRPAGPLSGRTYKRPGPRGGPGRMAGGYSAASIPAVIAVGRKPFTVSHTPSENSQAATGSAAHPCGTAN